MKTQSKLASAVAAVAKTILGANLDQPATVKVPKAVHEIHVSPTEIIPAGTIITDEIAELAGFVEETLDELIEKGAAVLVDMLAAALPTPAAD